MLVTRGEELKNLKPDKIMTTVVDAAAELPFDGINAADIVPLIASRSSSIRLYQWESILEVLQKVGEPDN